MHGHRTALLIAGVVLASGCSSGRPAADAADRSFLQDMLPHHEQAVAAGRLAASAGTDPRVVSFGLRIVREQTPEIARMKAMVSALGLRLSASAGAAMAVNRITPATLTSVSAEPPGARDHDLMADSATSEIGAVQMARAEVDYGTYPPALAVARSIVSAASPGSEINQLQRLAALLPG